MSEDSSELCFGLVLLEMLEPCKNLQKHKLQLPVRSVLILSVIQHKGGKCEGMGLLKQIFAPFCCDEVYRELFCVTRCVEGVVDLSDGKCYRLRNSLLPNFRDCL